MALGLQWEADVSRSRGLRVWVPVVCSVIPWLRNHLEASRSDFTGFGGFVICGRGLEPWSLERQLHPVFHPPCRFSMITPNILRLENEEKVLLEAHDYGGNLAVTVSVYDFPDRKLSLSRGNTYLTKDNDHMSTVNIKVRAPAGAPPRSESPPCFEPIPLGSPSPL